MTAAVSKIPISEVIKLARRPEAASMSREWWDDVAQMIADDMIGVHETPSEHPGVSGFPGASPKQLDLQEKFFSGEYRGIYAAGGNRSGKTSALWGLCGLKYIRDYAHDGEIYWCIAPDFTKLKLGPHKWFWDYLPKSMFPPDRPWTEAMGLGANPVIALTLPNNRGRATIVFKTEEQSIQSFESDSVTGILWTEAEKEQIFDSVWSRLVDTNGWLLIDYLPTKGWHRFRLKEHTNPKWYHVGFSMMDNAHNLPEGAIEDARASMSEEEAAIRIDGKDRAGFGVVYKQFDPDRHIVQPFEIPKSWPRYRSFDYGYRHPTAMVWGAVSPNQTLYIYREVYASEQTVKQNADKIKQYSEGENYVTTVADPSIWNITQSDGGSISSAYAREGIAMVPAERTNIAGEQASVDRVRLWLSAGKIKFFGPSRTGPCANTIREHQIWRYKQNTEGQPLSNEPFEDRDNHTCDAVRYMIALNPCYTDASNGGFTTFDDDNL